MLEQGLDQLWYTWSTAGLGSMPMGYRVRAASEGLHDVQSLRYRQIDRYLRYELPQGINIYEFDVATAPVSLSFVQNGDERLLMRKVFKGRDASGRYQVYFSHLIAGLPPEFTARDAIRLWYCPSLWRESDDGLAKDDTLLQKIPFSVLSMYAQNSRVQFDFELVRGQLIGILQAILTQGMPEHIHILGQSALSAALIHGVMHTLPINLIGNLTFSTYENSLENHEEVLVCTITAAELAKNTGLSMKLMPSFAVQEAPISTAIQSYVDMALSYLMGTLSTGETKKFSELISEAEKKSYTAARLLDVFMQRFNIGPLTGTQLTELVKEPADNVEDLLAPAIQREAAALLLNDGAYWQKEGDAILTEAMNRLASTSQDQAAKALATFINALAEYVIESMQTVLLQFAGDWASLNYCGHLLQTLAPPAQNASLWQRLLKQWAQEPYYSRIKEVALWPFQLWLLKRALQMRPLPTEQQILPWLSIPTWEKLDEVLKLSPSLPTEWERIVIWQRIEKPERIPKPAVGVVQTHEAKFRDELQFLFQQHNAQSIDVVVQFFQAMVNHWYPNRVSLLIFLLNNTPDPAVIERLFAAVPPLSEHQLVVAERDMVLEACSLEVLVVRGLSPTLTTYIQEYVESLTPNKLSNPRVLAILKQLSTESTLPSTIATLVASWLSFASFLNRSVINRGEAERVGEALASIMQVMPPELRAPFRESLISVLVKRVSDEIDITYVVDTLGQTLFDARWELLLLMAEEAGKGYARQPVLSRVTPYLLLGIREALATQQSQLALDTYLHSLYTNVDSEAYKKIEMGMSLGFWPEAVQQTWREWRKREGAVNGRGGNLGPGRRRTDEQSGQRQEPQAVPQQEAPPVFNGQAAYQGAPPAQQGKTILLPAMDATQQAKKYAQVKSTTREPEYVAVMQKYKDGLPLSTYQGMHPIMQQTVGYWHRYLEKKQGNGSKALSYEINMIYQLWQDLSGPKKGEVSRNLAQYLVDNYLIKREIDQLEKAGKVAPRFFDVDRLVVAHLDDFCKTVGTAHYQQVCDVYSEERLRGGVRILIRRFNFLQHLEKNTRTDLQSWLQRERRRADVILYV